MHSFYAMVYLFSSSRYIQSWIDKREVQSEKANLTILFERYVPPCLETLKHRFKKITPVQEVSMLQMLCYLLEALLTPDNTPPDCPKEHYELYFVFAAVWAFGGAMFQDQVCIHLHMYRLLASFRCAGFTSELENVGVRYLYIFRWVVSACTC